MIMVNDNSERQMGMEMVNDNGDEGQYNAVI